MIHRRYVITPSVAVYGGLPLEILSRTQQQQVVASNAFLSRATFHGAELHVPTTFYFDVTQFAFELYKRRLISFEDSKILTQDVLGAAWEYHFPTTDDILEVKHEFPDLANTEYVALARDKGYPLICTDAMFAVAVQHPAILLLEHPWAIDGALELYPPTLP